MQHTETVNGVDTPSSIMVDGIVIDRHIPIPESASRFDMLLYTWRVGDSVAFPSINKALSLQAAAKKKNQKVTIRQLNDEFRAWRIV